MSRLKVISSPIRNEALQAALHAEKKFQAVWASLSRQEKLIYQRAHGETIPYSIDQFQGQPKIKEFEDDMPIGETKPNKIDQFQGQPKIKENIDNVSIDETVPTNQIPSELRENVDILPTETMPTKIDQFQGQPRIKENEALPSVEVKEEVVAPENDFYGDDMERILEILTRPALVNPLRRAEKADFMKPFKKVQETVKPHLDTVNKVVKATPTVISEHKNKISENAKKTAAEWHAKSPMEKVAHAGQHVAKAVSNVLHHSKNHLKHEVEMYHGAAKALGHLATGKKWGDLDPHHRKHLKHAIIHAGITAGSMAAGDPTGGHAAHGVGQAVGQLLSHFGAEHAHHALTLGAGNVALKSVKDAYKKAISSMQTPKKISKLEVEKEAKRIIKLLIDADIPENEWAEIIDTIKQKTKKDFRR